MTQSEIAIININNGEVTLFDSMGRFKQGGLPLSPLYLNGCTPMKCISILNSGQYNEAAFVDENDNITIIPPIDGVGSNSASVLNAFGQFVRLCMKTGEEQGIKYTQMLFLYTPTINLNGILIALGAKNG